MSYLGSLESVVKVEKAKIGLGDSKPEEFTLIGANGKRAELAVPADVNEEYSEAEIAFPASDGEQPEFAVVSTDYYELKYKDPAAKDDVGIAYVQYQPDGSSAWINLKTAHSFKRREGVADLNALLKVKFRVRSKAIPPGKTVKVEVYIATSKCEPAPTQGKVYGKSA